VSWDNGDGANYGAVFRSRLFDQMLAADDTLTLEDVERINRVNGTTELEFSFFRDHIVRSGLRSKDPEIRTAATHLSRWDGRREDNDGDDRVDSEPGYSLWKGWRSTAIRLAFADEFDTFVNRTSDSMLLHVLDGKRASLVKSRDYLNGTSRDAFLDQVMRANLDALATQFGSGDQRTYRSPMPKQHYTRLNARFYDCEVVRSAASRSEGCNDAQPGNVESLDLMNRGTYNHIVEFRPGRAADATPAAGSGESWVERRPGFVVEAESIISPGQSGQVDQQGRQSPHYEDQHKLYGSWRYKPMPLREQDVAFLGGATTTLTYEPAAATLRR
jgi:acyl-homoserine lactone acylase PvdQ